MPAPKAKYRFESEVHLGLLSIILVLVLMSLVSNFVLFNARVRLQEETANQLRAASVTVSRFVREQEITMLSPAQAENLRRQLDLGTLMVVPGDTPGGSIADRARWIGAVLRQTPPDQVPEIVDKLLAADLKKLTRGKNNQFFMVAPVPLGPHKHLLILSTANPDLAYLQDAGRVILWVGFGATLLVALVYFVLSRSIFKPFRKIREEAVRSGRHVSPVDNEADLVVEEYRQVIAELQQKEAELLRLNEAIRSRADSLEQFNQYLLTSIDSGIITTDSSCHIKSVNEAAATILGLAEAQLVGQSIEHVFEKDSIINQYVHLALQGSPIPAYKEISYASASASNALLGISVSAIRDAHHGIIGASLILNDLTEVTRLRQQVEQKNRLEALGEMAAGLAHQLRNSVGAIGGFGNLLKRRLLKLEQPAEIAESLLKEAKEAEDLISKFLAFARPLKPQLEPVSLRTILEEIVTSVAATPRNASAHLSLRVAADGRLSADTVLLKQALTNLVDNAINAYDGAPGTVDISLLEENKMVQVVIRDHGCGIPSDQLDKIFTPFYSSRPSGTGLGLPFTSRIVDLHGGRIRVDSAVGHGTTVTVSLPVEPSFQTV